MSALPMLSTLQATASEAATGLDESLRLIDAPPAWIFVLVVLPLLLGVTWLGYFREGLARGWKVALIGLRFLALLLLCVVLFRPVLVERREEIHPAEVVVLVDESASMQRMDGYAGAPELQRALRTLDNAEPSSRTRSDLVRSALEKRVLPTLSERGYDVRLAGFHQELVPLADTSNLSARGNATHIGDGLLQALASGRGRYVTDVVVFSDGRNTGGAPVLDAGGAASAAGIPVHTVVVGDTRPERNVVLEIVESPKSALDGDEIAVIARVVGRGTNPEERAEVILEELDDSSSANAPRLVAQDQAALTDGGERVVLVAPASESGSLTGVRRFRVSVPPIPGETLTDDNSAEISVRISREKIRVLYVDGYPRWEYRFLKNMLLRADENIQSQMFLLSATSDFPQEASEGMESLSEVPADRRQLLDNYDVVILGDVNPYEISPDPARGEAFVEALRDFVEGGGGLLFHAGEFDNPRSFPPRSPLEDMLPVIVDADGGGYGAGLREDYRESFQPLLESPTVPHEIVRLHADLDINQRLWEDEAGLRGQLWYYPISRAKPSSQVLLRHPSRQNHRGELLPLMVAGYYPAGRTLFLAIDSTYRWRYHYGDRYHDRFWRNAIRWLALGRLKSGDRRFRLETSRSSYHLDERVILEARVLDEDYRPSRRPSIEVRWSGPDQRPETTTLNAVEGRDGQFRGTLQLESPGFYRAWAGTDDEVLSSVEFEVLLPSRENADPSPDPLTLAGLAGMTNGAHLHLGEVEKLLDQFPGDEERREPISSRLADAWDHWGTLLLALALLSAEWILRKRMELV